MIDRLEDITIEHLYLDALPDELSHLAANDLLQVIYDYQSDMTVKEILYKYSIDIKPSKFKKSLPLILNGVCEFCSSNKLFWEVKPPKTVYLMNKVHSVLTVGINL